MSAKVLCGMRYIERSTKRDRTELTCTLERGHEKPVHEMTLNGKWLGGWVDQWRPDGTPRLGIKAKEQEPPLDMPANWRGEPIAPEPEQPSLFDESPRQSYSSKEVK